MKTIAMLIFALLFTVSAIAADSDQLIFEKHLEEANQWINARKDVKISRSHYGPVYHKDLSVVRDVQGHTYIDYYWTMGPNPWAPSNQYPFNFSDILVRFDVSKSEFRLIYYQPSYAGKQENKQDGGGQPASRPESK
jgi:hypothetical protein